MRYNDLGCANSGSPTPRFLVFFWYVDVVLITHGPKLNSRLFVGYRRRLGCYTADRRGRWEELEGLGSTANNSGNESLWVFQVIFFLVQ